MEAADENHAMRETPSSTDDAGPTLHDLIMMDAIERAVADAAERRRLTPNIHHLATRALFAGTEKVPNRELMRALRGEAKKVARGDTREVRYHRYRLDEAQKAVPERTLKIDRFRQIVLHLLANRMVSNADAVRAWEFALVQEAARVVVAEARKEGGGPITLAALKATPALAQQMLHRCEVVLAERIKKYLEQSNTALAEGRPLAEERQFLDFAATLVIDAMREPISPWSAIRDILSNVYPELDRYRFGPEEDGL